jgi:hypothetical protein
MVDVSNVGTAERTFDFAKYGRDNGSMNVPLAGILQIVKQSNKNRPGSELTPGKPISQEREIMKSRLNNTDREQWIDNDEGLYNWWRSTRLSKRQFIRQNREELDRCILNVLDGHKPAHYLAYDRNR